MGVRLLSLQAPDALRLTRTARRHDSARHMTPRAPAVASVWRRPRDGIDHQNVNWSARHHEFEAELIV